MKLHLGHKTSLGSLLAGVLLLAPTVGFGHARLLAPLARNNNPGLKDPYGPCGNVARTTMSTTYQPGQSVLVKWEETIDHPGCFIIDFSPAGDANWQQLSVVKHKTLPAIPPTMPRPYEATVNMPAGVSCDGCTLRLRQIMLANDALACPPTNIVSGATYYSCADVTVPQPPDMSVLPDFSTPPSVDMAVVDPGPGPDPGAMASGCSLTRGPVGLMTSAWAALLLGGAALGLRRRRARAVPQK